MKNVTLLSVIMAIVLALSIVITAIFGVNYAATVSNQNTLTVTMKRFVYDNRLDDVKAVCEKEFEKLSVQYTYNGKMNGDECELVYVFDQTTKLDDVKASLKQAVANKAAENGEWEFIEVATASEVLQTSIPVAYVVRAAVAVAVFAVLAFIYVALRYRLYMGVTTAIAVLLSGIMTAAIILLARIPVTSSAMYAVVISSVLAAIFTVLTMNKIRSCGRESIFVGCDERNCRTHGIAWRFARADRRNRDVALALVCGLLARIPFGGGADRAGVRTCGVSPFEKSGGQVGRARQERLYWRGEQNGK